MAVSLIHPAKELPRLKEQTLPFYVMHFWYLKNAIMPTPCCPFSSLIYLVASVFDAFFLHILQSLKIFPHSLVELRSGQSIHDAD